MLTDLLFLALPLGGAMAAAAALRLAGGSDTGGRLANVSVPAGFLAVWTWLHGPTVVPAGLLEVTAHIALGGAAIGVVLDATAARRRWAVIVGTGFILAGAWAALGLAGLTRPLPASGAEQAAMAISAAIIAAGWAVTLVRLGRHGTPEAGGEGAALLAALAGGLGLIAVAAGAPSVALPAAGLSAAALGFLALAAPLRLPFGRAATLGGGGALLGLAQALAVAWPVTLVPVAILGLGLFATATAAALPGGPRARAAWTLALGLLPGVLAAAIALALRGVPPG